MRRTQEWASPWLGLAWLGLAWLGLAGCSSPPPAAPDTQWEEVQEDLRRFAAREERDRAAMWLLTDPAEGSLHERLQRLPAPLLGLARLGAKEGFVSVLLRAGSGDRARVSVRLWVEDLEVEAHALPDTEGSVQLDLTTADPRFARYFAGELYLMHAAEHRFLLVCGEEPPLPLVFGPLPYLE